jgi:CheY-like chemotaxis protein
MITILYVENDENDVLFMHRGFKLAGLEDCLRALPDGRAAKNYLMGEAPYADRTLYPVPGLLLMDVNLPAISGLELLGWTRKQPQFREVPIVIFSSSVWPDDIKRAFELGANDYLQKPTSGSQFVEVAQKLKERWPALTMSEPAQAPR